MANEHGIKITESPTTMPMPTQAANGAVVVFGTAPVNMAADPSASVNTPILCTTYDEAVEAFGYSDDFLNYTICASIYAHFAKEGSGPVIFVNVLDPDLHTKTLAETTVKVSGKQATIEQEGVLKDGLVVKNDTATLTKDKDYTLSFNADGTLVITLAGSVASAATELKVSGKQLDPSIITENTIIGGYDTETKKRTGIEVLSDVYPKTGMTPSVILAPYWSRKPNVAKILQLKAEKINGVFRAFALLDMDTSSTRTYTEVGTGKDAQGATDSDAYTVWPMVVSGDHKAPIPYSAALAAAMQSCDIDHESVPSRSPSNRTISWVTGTVLEDGTPVHLDNEEATEIEGHGVGTIYRWAGAFRIWGDYTCAYPVETDAKDYWINARRMFSWQNNSFATLYFPQLDGNISYKLIESIVDSENIRIAGYVPDHLAAGHIEFRAKDNPDDQITAGKIKFKQYLSPYVPAKVIENDMEYDLESMIKSLFGSQEA